MWNQWFALMCVTRVPIAAIVLCVEIYLLWLDGGRSQKWSLIGWKMRWSITMASIDHSIDLVDWFRNTAHLEGELSKYWVYRYTVLKEVRVIQTLIFDGFSNLGCLLFLPKFREYVENLYVVTYKNCQSSIVLIVVSWLVIDRHAGWPPCGDTAMRGYRQAG